MPVAIPLVTERWSQQSFSLGSSATRVFDITTVDDIAAAQTLLYTAEQIGEGASHPHDPRLKVVVGGIKIAGGRGNRNFVGTVEYRAPSGGGGGGNDSWSLDQKWQCQVDPTEIEERTDHTPLFHIGITNSARDPFDEQFTRPLPNITISMWRWEGSIPLSKHIAYRNRVNIDFVNLPKLGTAAPGELICKSIRPMEAFDAEATLLKIVYNFEARPRITVSTTAAGSNDLVLHGFYRRVMDIGMQGNIAGNTLHKITRKVAPDKGSEVTFPVRLNGRGVPLDTASYDMGGTAGTNLAAPPTTLDITTDAVFLMYDLTDGPATFAGLNIGANL